MRNQRGLAVCCFEALVKVALEEQSVFAAWPGAGFACSRGWKD
jgi:hypothetical protein